MSVRIDGNGLPGQRRLGDAQAEPRDETEIRIEKVSRFKFHLIAKDEFASRHILD